MARKRFCHKCGKKVEVITKISGDICPICRLVIKNK